MALYRKRPWSMLFSSYALILNEGVSIFSRTPLARSVSSSTCLKKRCNQYHVFWEVKGSVLRLCPLNGISSLSTHAGPSTGPMQTVVDNKTHGKPGLSDRLLRTLGWLGGFYSRKAILTRSAILLYEQCVDKVDYEAFFRVCGLPDSFQSWFLVAQLHVWLCLVRLKREGKDGEFVIRQFVQFFWKDVEERMRVLGVHSGKVASEGLQELSRQFKGLILAYEEGLLSSDKKLAAAVWRIFVHDKEHTDPVMLAVMVDYIRGQVKQMDLSDSHSLLQLAKMNTIPLTVRLS